MSTKRALSFAQPIDDKRPKYGGDEGRLYIHPIEQYVYANHPIDVRVDLEIPNKTIAIKSIPLHVELVYVNEETQTGARTTTPIDGGDCLLEIMDKSAMYIEGSNRSASTGGYVRGSTTMKLCIKDTSKNHQNREFAIVVSAQKSGVPTHAEVRHVISSPLKVVKFKLVIKELSGIDDDGLWYKDQGGRDKAISLKLQMLDHNGSVALPSVRIPLCCKLMYGNGSEVVNKNLLKISPECSQSINEDGCGDIKYRIEDVSKNHQKNSFCLHVCPDYEMNQAFTDIAPVMSPKVNVKSKISKRPKPEHKPSPYSYVDAMPRPEAKQQPMQNTVMSTRCPASQTGLGSTQESMHKVIEWAGMVIKGIESMEWVLYGYELGTDGLCDKDKPIYRCPACKVIKSAQLQQTKHQRDCYIAKIMLEYSYHVYHHLAELLKAVEKEGEEAQTMDGSST